MSGARINFGFIPFPLAIVDDGVDLTLGEYRLLGYLLRHRFRVKSESMRLTQDDLLQGVRAPSGVRRDRGCAITSPRDLKAARERLEARGWVKVVTDSAGAMIYEVCLEAEDELGTPDSAKCTDAGESAFCSDGECNLSSLRVQNAPTLIGSKKVEKREVIQLPSPPSVEAPSLVLVADEPKPAKDARFTPCVDACKAYASEKDVTFQWGPAEGKQLKELLATAAGLTVEMFRECLSNRARSAVAHGEPPRVWLPTLLKYQDGPLDRFGKPEGREHGANQRSDAGRSESSRNRGERVTDSNIAAARRIYQSVVEGVA